MSTYIELEGDEASRVVIPHFVLGGRQPQQATALVKFEGRGRVAYHGADRFSTWTAKAIYNGPERPQAVALMALLDQAFEEAKNLHLVSTVSMFGELLDVVAWVSYSEGRARGSITNLDLVVEEVDPAVI